MAVRHRAGHGHSADAAAGAAAVLDDHRLAQRFAERDVDDARRDVGAATGWEARDHGYWALRIFGAHSGRRDRRNGGQQHPLKNRKDVLNTCHAFPPALFLAMRRTIMTALERSAMLLARAKLASMSP